MNIIKSLQALSAYPIPYNSLCFIAESNGFAVGDDIDLLDDPTENYIKAKAETYKWLADAPAVSQQGISYSFSDTERKHFRSLANDLLGEINESGSGDYGYKGDSL